MGMENQRVIGRFVLAGEEVERDWIAIIVTRLTANGKQWQAEEPNEFHIPDFKNQFEEIKWWASTEGLAMMDSIMCIVPDASEIDSTDDDVHCPHCG
jgi:hypothetical protein